MMLERWNLAGLMTARMVNIMMVLWRNINICDSFSLEPNISQFRMVSFIVSFHVLHHKSLCAHFHFHFIFHAILIVSNMKWTWKCKYISDHPLTEYPHVRGVIGTRMIMWVLSGPDVRSTLALASARNSTPVFKTTQHYIRDLQLKKEIGEVPVWDGGYIIELLLKAGNVKYC